jgi:hypothetical protein
MTNKTSSQQRAGLVAEAATLRAQLAAARDLAAVKAEDVWARREQEAEHAIAMATVDERAMTAKRERRERARDTKDAEALAALYRRATRSGARARLRAQIQGSAEVRALRIAKVRTVTLAVGIPVLIAFAAWSTTGVQAGVTRLLDLTPWSASWSAAWLVEPALITVVGAIIIGRAVLRSSGGNTDWRAAAFEWGFLSLSLALNIVGGWPTESGDFWTGLGTALPHSIGPLGCAGTAFLIGLFDSYVTDARPWHQAPRLADIDLTAPLTVPPMTAPAPAPVAAAESIPAVEPVSRPAVETATENTAPDAPTPAPPVPSVSVPAPPAAAAVFASPPRPAATYRLSAADGYRDPGLGDLVSTLGTGESWPPRTVPPGWRPRLPASASESGAESPAPAAESPTASDRDRADEVVDEAETTLATGPGAADDAPEDPAGGDASDVDEDVDEADGAGDQGDEKGADDGGLTATERARAYWDDQIAQGRIPTGAEMDRQVGTANYCSKLRRQWITEPAAQEIASASDGRRLHAV